MTPKFFKEKAVVVDFKDDCSEFLCLFIKEDYEQPICYEEDDYNDHSVAIKKSGFESGAYYEFLKIKVHNISKIYDKFLSEITLNYNIVKGVTVSIL